MHTQFLIFFLLLTSYLLPSNTQEETGLVGSLDRKLLGLDKKETLSHFRFYWHEILNGSNMTSVVVVPPLAKNNTNTSFGAVGIFDNVLRSGPELNSTVVGIAEGLYAAASQSELVILEITNFVLTQGKYNGSTITFLGRNPIFHKVREMPVIGGTGVFRFARGYVQATTLSIDPKTKNNHVEFNVYVYY